MFNCQGAEVLVLSLSGCAWCTQGAAPRFFGAGHGLLFPLVTVGVALVQGHGAGTVSPWSTVGDHEPCPMPRGPWSTVRQDQGP